jgi:hypothetical protein
VALAAGQAPEAEGRREGRTSRTRACSLEGRTSRTRACSLEGTSLPSAHDQERQCRQGEGLRDRGALHRLIHDFSLNQVSQSSFFTFRFSIMNVRGTCSSSFSLEQGYMSEFVCVHV